jgi:glucose-1-phosphate thymidylyltransferase
LETYLNDGTLSVENIGRGYAWLDTGTHASLLDASNFVRTLTERQGLQVGSPDEVAYRLKWITKDQILERAQKFEKSNYGHYLRKIK